MSHIQNDEPMVARTPAQVSALPSPWAKFFLIYAGVVAPLAANILLRLGDDAYMYPSYQTGRLGDILSFSFKLEYMWPHYPLMVFAIGSFCLVLYDEKRYATHSVVLLGIFSGILISVWFHFVLVTKMAWMELLIFHLVPLLAIAIVIAMLWLYRWAAHRGFNFFKIVSISFALVIALASLVTLIAFDNPLGALFLIASPLLLILCGIYFTTVLATFAYAYVLTHVVRRYHPKQRFSLGALMMLWFPWFAIFFASVRHSVVQSMQLYSTLPLQPEKCFVVSAAARGHPGFVGSFPQIRNDQNPFMVNRQLHVFKAFEFVLLTLNPCVYRRLRAAYNLAGPILAKQMVNPWIADLVFLLLKPSEWFVAIFLRILLGDRFRDLICEKLGTEPLVLTDKN